LFFILNFCHIAIYKKFFKGYTHHPYAKSSKASQHFCMFGTKKIKGWTQKTYAMQESSKAGGGFRMFKGWGGNEYPFVF